MSIAELRRQAKQTIDRLSGPRLRVVTDLLMYIQQARSNDPTRELLESPGFLKSFARGMSDVSAGRVRDWRRVRRDV